MKTRIRNLSPRWFALLAAIMLAFAQGGAHAQGTDAFSQQELDQMLAPIALYPDPLLSQILMAATYPSEVAEAARWSRARPGLSGDDAVRAAEDEDWDASVRSLLAFPQVLEHMDENPQWTQNLGDAFLDQQAQLMDTVQTLRRRAAAAGNLLSDDRLRVIDSGSGLMLEPLDPRIVYVPYYDPLVAYGPWWWPAYPPVYLRPRSAYFARPGYARAIYWGPPVSVSAGFFFGAFDWPRRQLRVVQRDNHYYRHGRVAIRPIAPNRAPRAWPHEAEAGMVQGRAATTQQFGTPQNQHSRIGISRPEERMDRRAVVPPQGPLDTRFDGRRDTRVRALPTVPAPVIQTAPAVPPQIRPEARFDGRRDARVSALPTAPAPLIQAAPAVPPQIRPEARFDGRRHTRVSAQPTAPAPVVLPAPTVQTAPVARVAPAPRPAPAVQPALAAPPAAAAPPAQAGHARPAEHAPRAKHEEQRAGGSARDSRDSQAAARPGAGANPGARPPGVR